MGRALPAPRITRHAEPHDRAGMVNNVKHGNASYRLHRITTKPGFGIIDHRIRAIPLNNGIIRSTRLRGFRSGRHENMPRIVNRIRGLSPTSVLDSLSREAHFAPDHQPFRNLASSTWDRMSIIVSPKRHLLFKNS